MRHIRTTAAAGLSLALAGCQPATIYDRDQWLAETSRVYQDRNPEQVIRAAEAVLNAADPGDVTFVHTPTGFTARRPWFATIIIASASGVDTYRFNAEPVPGGTKATISIEHSPDQGNRNATTANSSIPSYRLFFNWLGYALGKEKQWVTCDEAPGAFSIENANMAPGICGPGHMSRGHNPVQPKPEWTRASQQSPARPTHSRDVQR